VGFSVRVSVCAAHLLDLPACLPARNHKQTLRKSCEDLLKQNRKRRKKRKENKNLKRDGAGGIENVDTAAASDHRRHATGGGGCLEEGRIADDDDTRATVATHTSV
jgi:hypothetical protein